eukprot:scaffold819_cov239-Pinguiococcus_pyrenoidosus.AAC.3
MLGNDAFAAMVGGGDKRGGGAKGGAGAKDEKFDLRKAIQRDAQQQKAKKLRGDRQDSARDASATSERSKNDPKAPVLKRFGYRDRAAERRAGLNPDYAGELEDLAAKKVDASMTKYLGGDVEHTHLVKGLDFALLHKVRKNVDVGAPPKAEKGSKSKKKDTSGSAAEKRAASTADVQSGAQNAASTAAEAQERRSGKDKGKGKSRKQEAKTPMAIEINSWAERVERSEAALEARTGFGRPTYDAAKVAFRFVVGGDEEQLSKANAFSVPATIIRSAYDAELLRDDDPDDPLCLASMEESLVEELQEALKPSSKAKKLRRGKHRGNGTADGEEKAATASTVDAEPRAKAALDFDIYDDIGAYDPSDAIAALEAEQAKAQEGKEATVEVAKDEEKPAAKEVDGRKTTAVTFDEDDDEEDDDQDEGEGEDEGEDEEWERRVRRKIDAQTKAEREAKAAAMPESATASGNAAGGVFANLRVKSRREHELEKEEADSFSAQGPDKKELAQYIHRMAKMGQMDGSEAAAGRSAFQSSAKSGYSMTGGEDDYFQEAELTGWDGDEGGLAGHDRSRPGLTSEQAATGKKKRKRKKAYGESDEGE